MTQNVSKPSNPSPPQDIPAAVEHLFRHESGKLVATLTGIFGVRNLELAEDVVQESLIRALQTWPYYGLPSNPSAWLMRTAKNLALDTLRREKVFEEKTPQIIAFVEQSDHGEKETLPSAEEIKDDTLRMIFACCHPSIPAEAQIALALKTLCGFGMAEIAKAFLTNEAAVAKRLTRAKQKLRNARIEFEIPSGEDLMDRLSSVLHTIYLLFNEGYKASTGAVLIREDLCREAIRLCGFLADHPASAKPQTHALLALMLFNAARLPARLDADGNILRLEDQDRSVWNRALIARGMFHLAKSAAGEQISKYHLEAGIAACHCTADSYAATDWERILALYDQLVAIDTSAVVALNRAVAVTLARGPAPGMAAVRSIKNATQLEGYYLYFAVLGHLELRQGNREQAEAHFRRALGLTVMPAERAFLAAQIRCCGRQEAVVRT